MPLMIFDKILLCLIFFLFLDEYRLNFIFVKISTKNFSHFTTLNCYRITTLKSNFLTPKSYSAPATVKFYTVSNFGRANKLRPISYKQAGSWKAGKLGVKLSFRIIKFENFLILRYNIYRKSRKTKKIKRS